MQPSGWRNWAVVAWFIRHKRRIGLAATGHTVMQVEFILFDWVLYALVSAYFLTNYGAVYGALLTFSILTPLSAIISWLNLKFYDWSKKDWFGFETLKELREWEQGGWLQRLMATLIRKGDVPAFLVLSIHFDPFMAVVYLRDKDHGHRLAGRDWRIFFGSILFSNAYWTLRWSVIMVIIQFIWELF